MPGSTGGRQAGTTFPYFEHPTCCCIVTGSGDDDDDDDDVGGGSGGFRAGTKRDSRRRNVKLRPLFIFIFLSFWFFDEEIEGRKEGRIDGWVGGRRKREGMVV